MSARALLGALALSSVLAVADALPAPTVLHTNETLAAQGSPRSFRLRVRDPNRQRQEADSSSRVPAIISRAVLDTSQDVNFRALVHPDTVYVGEQVTYELGVFLERGVRDRLRRMEAIAPEMRGMMAYDPPAPLSGFPARTIGPLRYIAHVYERAIFPLAPGRVEIPPARLVYAMPLSYSFFSREESFEIQSDSVSVVVLEPPVEGRPAGWKGAVGSISVAARVDSAGARVGDAVRLTVSVSGEGNVKLFPRPTLELRNASAVPAGERVTLSSDSLDVSGVKEFDWIVTPLHEGRLVLPQIRYPYFDPRERSYSVARAPALSLDVAPGSLAAAEPGTKSRAPWPVRAEYRGALPLEPYQRPGFWWLLVLAPAPAVAMAVVRRPRRRRSITRSPRRELNHLARGTSTDARAIRRAFLASLAQRLRVSSSSIADPRGLSRHARRAGAAPETAARAAALLEELDSAAFSTTAAARDGLASRAEDVYRTLDAESRRFRDRRVRGSVLFGALLALALAAGAHAAAFSDDARQYSRGVDAYHRGAYSLAARDFASVAARVPRAADAWANLGTAAYAAGDTGRAVAGWERALRLEPRASDVRERLDVAGPGTIAGIAGVPSLSPAPIAIVALVTWAIAWLALAWLIGRRARGSDIALAFTAIGAAVALGTAVAVIDARLAARDVVVGARETRLRLLPALASESQASLHAGDLARVMDRDGAWLRISLGGGRSGWTDSASVYPIARD
jgi:tetratricopeptide (TPR) repeat protein